LENQREGMQSLGRPCDVALSLLVVTLGTACAVTEAEALTSGPPSDVVKPIPGVSAYAGLSDGFEMEGATGQNGVPRETAPGPVISAWFANAPRLALHAPFRGARGEPLIGDDPFGLWTVIEQGTPETARSLSAMNAETTKYWPIIVSAGALLMTTVFGWRLIKRRRYKVLASPGNRSDETETTADVARYIMGAVAPRSLARRKKRRRKASSRSGRTETTADVARAVVEIVLPRTTRKKRRRSSRRSAGAHRS